METVQKPEGSKSSNDSYDVEHDPLRSGHDSQEWVWEPAINSSSMFDPEGIDRAETSCEGCRTGSGCGRPELVLNDEKVYEISLLQSHPISQAMACTCQSRGRCADGLTQRVEWTNLG